MGFLSSLFGSDQAKAAYKGAKIVSQAEQENEQFARDTLSGGLDDLDSALASALGQFDEGMASATGALQPFADAGTSALSVQADLMGLNGPERQAAARERFQTDPAYQFRLSEGINALDQSATARGGLYSGRAMKDLNRFGQGLASEEFGNYYNRLSDLATRGQNAATNISGTLSQFARDKAGAYLGTGQNKGTLRLSTLPHITGAHTGAATAKATGIKQATDAKAAGAGNLLSVFTRGIQALSGFA